MEDQKLTIQISSDLHLEYKNNNSIVSSDSYIKPNADVLVLAGDIGCIYKYDQLNSFLTDVCKKFKIVLYVIGNQELYKPRGYSGVELNVLYEKFYKIESSIDNLYILNRSSVKIGNVCIIGCTLWSEPKVKIPPFICRIFGMNDNLYQHKHSQDLQYIQKMINYCQNNSLKLVVITHYCPSFSVLNNNNIDEYSSLYATDLDSLLTKNKVSTWICGHNHTNFDMITPGGTRIVSNQKGKPRDNITDFSVSKVINV
jgi:predicted phosphodiesterase